MVFKPYWEMNDSAFVQACSLGTRSFCQGTYFGSSTSHGRISTSLTGTSATMAGQADCSDSHYASTGCDLSHGYHHDTKCAGFRTAFLFSANVGELRISFIKISFRLCCESVGGDNQASERMLFSRFDVIVLGKSCSSGSINLYERALVKVLNLTIMLNLQHANVRDILDTSAAQTILIPNKSLMRIFWCSSLKKEYFSNVNAINISV